MAKKNTPEWRKAEIEKARAAKAAAEGKTNTDEAADTIRKADKLGGEEVPPVNGIKFVVNETKVWVVRERAGLTPVPEDWRENPTDVVQAKFIGYTATAEEGPQYGFDDGRVKDLEWLFVLAEDAEDWIHKSKEDAQAQALKVGRVFALRYAREDYADARLKMAATVKNEEVFKEALKNASAGDLVTMAKALGGSAYKTFAGIEETDPAKKLAAKRKAVASLRASVSDADRGKMYATAKGFADQLVAKWGEDVKVTVEEADAKEREAREAEIAKEKAERKAQRDAERKEKRAAKEAESKANKPKGKRTTKTAEAA